MASRARCDIILKNVIDLPQMVQADIAVESDDLDTKFLLCDEVMSTLSDNLDAVHTVDQNVDIYECSDDSTRDRDYIPDSFEDTSEDEILISTASQKKASKQLRREENYPAIQQLNNQHLQQKNIEAKLNTSQSIQKNNTNIDLKYTSQSPDQQNNTEIELNTIQPPQQNLTEVEFNTCQPIQTYHTEVELNSSHHIQQRHTEIELTKKGKPRKRKKIEESLEERRINKIQKQNDKLSIKPPCSSSCIKKCITKINEQQRKDIHKEYLGLTWEAQGLFIKCLVDEKPVARRVQNNREIPKRKITYKYFLKSNNLNRTEVCKTFFLGTLGYNAKNDTRILGALQKPIDCQQTDRGKYERKNKIDKEIIKEHIMTFNPCVSHYRREHAPKKMYLPSDITITMMFTQFCSKMPNIRISLEFYRKVVKEMNISFAHLGNEECEQCVYFERHDPNHINNQEASCEICKRHSAHKRRYRETRKEYRKDVILAADSTDDVYYSVDLQKVVMLPRMEQYKAAIFCPRIIAFNESFVPLGPTKHHLPYAALWHEAVSGRLQEDIISSFAAFLMYKRDAKHIVFWLDNCAAQNKNWAFLSFLVYIVNSGLIAAETITLKYLEPGHTFMSADSFHHQVELSLKRKNKVYDFSDYVDSVQVANSCKNFVKIMQISDFFNYQDYSSQQKLRKKEPRVYLKDLMVVIAERGLFELNYKYSHQDEQPLSLDFLQAKIIRMRQFPELRPKTASRGVTEERKAAILAKLVPLMPENRREFWRNLPTSNMATDLSENI